jgi:D-alanyl-D-alanine carboxypeptidase/Family of unknown function (DUF5715)
MIKTKRIFLVIVIIIFVLYIFKNPIFDFYVLKQNERKIMKIKIVNPDNYNQFLQFVQEVEKQTSWKIYITSTYRSFEEQAKLKKQDPRNASPGNSKHNFAKAIDIVLYQNTFWWQRWIEKRSKKELWLSSKIVAIAKKHHLIWGGNFSKYYNPVHFEIE